MKRRVRVVQVTGSPPHYSSCSGPDRCPVCVAQRFTPEERAFREAEKMREEIQQAEADREAEEG